MLAAVLSHVTFWFLSLFFAPIYSKSFKFSASSIHFLTSYSLRIQNQLDYLSYDYISQTSETAMEKSTV